MRYYKNFRIVIGTPLWRFFLRWVYAKSIDDFKKLKFTPNFQKKDFICLLCGVGNEVTADEFIKFVLQRNNQAKIYIIDLGDEQIAAVRDLVKQKYQNVDITVKRLNALDLETMLSAKSINWIETDGLFEFFDYDSLERLLKVWGKILKEDGFITTRANSTKGIVDRGIDNIKVWGGRVWLNITTYSHTREKLHNLFKSTGFKFTQGSTPLLTYKRYSLIKGR